MAQLVNRCNVLDHVETQVQFSQSINPADAINVLDEVVRSEDALEVDQLIERKVVLACRLIFFENLDIFIPQDNLQSK